MNWEEELEMRRQLIARYQAMSPLKKTWARWWPKLFVLGLAIGAVVFYWFVGFWDAWF